ncbi:MAG: 2-C-methyl-D-erythritol 4-phosphate cytidylyltransferase [Acidimicrobiia bacterium]|nr:2-C-methyl-D-erythritol 4-phosphate cytidylyltransferase [Acidimicrobiia bacterium]
MGADGPKQFLELDGIPLLAHSVTAFERSNHVTDIVVVSHPEHIETSELIVGGAGVSKVKTVVAGGPSRSDSSRAAIDEVPDGDGLILIHDAARPLVATETIDAVIAALGSHMAAAPAVAASDTIVMATGDEINATLDRRSLRHLQTPQGFEISTIREAYRLAGEDPAFEATDDCGVVHRYLPDVTIKLVPGSTRNLKITRVEDLAVAAALLGGV